MKEVQIWRTQEKSVANCEMFPARIFTEFTDHHCDGIYFFPCVQDLLVEALSVEYGVSQWENIGIMGDVLLGGLVLNMNLLDLVGN